MKLREIMTQQVVRIGPEESVAVAARTLAHYNIGVLPVCGGDGRLWGMVTDRDLVTRCVASGRNPAATTVREIMTKRIVSVRQDMEVEEAAEIMGREQIRRLPVMENDRLCGIVSLADIVNLADNDQKARFALHDVSRNLSVRD